IWDFWARLDAEDAAQRQRIDMIARADVLDSPDHGKA
ncbi:MAG: hypothetical protein JWO98_4713, partial [Frankiales bacterium]|nr:hypothetical protein [Frankiales bacterium]